MKAMIINLLGISFQTNMATTKQEIAMLETHILLPALGIILIGVIIAGIAITVQKHKRY